MKKIGAEGEFGTERRIPVIPAGPTENSEMINEVDTSVTQLITPSNLKQNSGAPLIQCPRDFRFIKERFYFGSPKFS